MNERATKKQKELLNYIDGFIKGNGYGPSYREVMRALDYKSVSTVATHIDGLIAGGYVRKLGSTARSLEVVNDNQVVAATSSKASQHKDWLARELRKKLDASNDAKKDKEAIKRVAEIFNITLS
jgi:SOS-response transcriptional repressor LexA